MSIPFEIEFQKGFFVRKHHHFFKLLVRKNEYIWRSKKSKKLAPIYPILGVYTLVCSEYIQVSGYFQKPKS